VSYEPIICLTNPKVKMAVSPWTMDPVDWLD